MLISQSERAIIRDLAKKLAGYSDLPVMAECMAEWERHNGLEKGRPMVLVYPEGSWNEILPDTKLKCESQKAREIEWKLRARIFRHEEIGDDSVVHRKWYVQKRISNTGWGLEVKDSAIAKIYNNWVCDSFLGMVPKIWDENFVFNDKASAYKPVIESPGDMKKLRHPEVIYDEKKSMEDFEEAGDLFGDILDVELKGIMTTAFAVVQDVCEFYGLEKVLYELHDNPAFVHELMSFFTEGYLKLIDQYEDMGLFSLNNNGTYHSSGGIGYTGELPKIMTAEAVLPQDMWGSAHSQEFAVVSPSMHEEFGMHYEAKLLERFGLNGYGCCEPIENKLEHVFKIPNMRRISIAPTANVAKCAEQIKGDYIFSWKFQPSYIASGFDTDFIGDYINKTLQSTKDCVVEIILKDTHTCSGEPDRFRQWTDVVRKKIGGE